MAITETGPQSASAPVMTFNQFDDTLNGPLTGVMIGFESTLGGNVTISLVHQEIDSNNSDTVQVSNDGTLTLDLGFPFGLSTPAVMATGNASCTDPDSATDCNDQTAIADTPGGMIVVSDLTPFIGTGTFDVTSTLTALIDVFRVPDNGTGFVDNATILGTLTGATASGSVTVKYTYGVPEPGVFILLCAGLAGALVQHRRRRSGV